MSTIRFNESRNIEAESEFLQYVLYVIKNSRSKRQAETRISGLISTRLSNNGSLITYTDSMIKDYELENEKKK